MSDTIKKSPAAPATAKAPAAKPAKSAAKAGDQPKAAKPDAKAADKKPKPAAKDKKEKQLHALQTYAGTVGAFGANPDGVYDRFELEVAGEPARTVKFPAHFGEELHKLAKPGHAVTVLGFPKTTPKGDEQLELARLDVAHKSVRPHAPGPAKDVTVSGTIEELHHTPKGDLDGLRLAGEQEVLRLPAHLSKQLAGHLVVGASLTGNGQRRALRPGEVAAHPAPVQLELLTVGDDSFVIH